MTEEVAPYRTPIGQPRNIGDIDQLLARRAKNEEVRSKVLSDGEKKKEPYNRIIASIDKQTMAVVEMRNKDDRIIDEAIKEYMLRRRKSLLRSFGKTIRLTNGVITWVVRKREVDSPGDDRDAIRYLLEKYPGGKQYLNVSYTLNKTALSECTDEKLLRALRGLSYRISRHEFLSIKPSSFKKAIVLSRRLYPRRK